MIQSIYGMTQHLNVVKSINPFKMGRRTKSEKYNLSKFSMQQISAEGIPGGVKFFLYNRDGQNISSNG